VGLPEEFDTYFRTFDQKLACEDASVNSLQGQNPYLRRIMHDREFCIPTPANSACARLVAMHRTRLEAWDPLKSEHALPETPEYQDVKKECRGLLGLR
jgi:hypothetical protein